jgi:putative DNA primase/helicase
LSRRGTRTDSTELPIGSTNENDRLVLSPVITRPTAKYFAEKFYRHEDFIGLRYWSGSFYAFNGRHYVRVDDLTLQGQLLDWLTGCVTERNTRFPANDGTVKGAVAALRCLYHVEQDTPAPCWLDGGLDRPDPSRLVVMRNGILDVETRELHAHDPRYFCVNGLDFDYDPEAGEPERWLRFLTELFGDDTEQIRLLRQWFGYVIVPDNSQEKALLIFGVYRSGKGTIATVLKKMIGESNVCGPTTSSLSGEFGLAQLVGKLLAVLGDARFKGTGSTALTERLLSIIGNDLIEVNRKHRDAISVVLNTRLLVLTNEPPQFNDASTALAKRFLCLRLTQSFYGREDPRLKDELPKELPAIFLWALDGLDDLKAQGKFTQPTSCADILRDIGELSSPVAQFFAERCELQADAKVSRDDLYAAWEGWCLLNGHDPGNSSRFGKDLRAVWPALADGWIGDKRAYRGLALRST